MDGEDNSTIRKAIAESLQNSLIERTVQFQRHYESKLRRIGLWAIPALIPYPLSKIVEHLSRNDDVAARKLLIRHCNSSFLSGRAKRWWDVNEFAKRQRLLEEAIGAHTEEKHNLSIHALVPHIEGIITDWIYRNIPSEDKTKWDAQSKEKAKKFRDVVLGRVPLTWAQSEIVRSVTGFIVNGPLLANFHWLGQINPNFAGRHSLAHGYYDDRIFTEENSAKTILLLDTIHDIVPVGDPSAQKDHTEDTEDS